ncbi:hypothetical protein MA04_03292, partial [Alcanivorax balearicus MACL04]|nr:hypothetical protein [Alloalcanivorax balearicus MACL04]
MGEGVAKYLGFGGGAVIITGLFLLYGILPTFDISIYLFLSLLLLPIAPILLGIMFIRRGFFSPSDHPTLFNRKTRQVYVIPVKPLNFLKFWEKGEPGKMKTYSWDNVTVR